MIIITELTVRQGLWLQYQVGMDPKVEDADRERVHLRRALAVTGQAHRATHSFHRIRWRLSHALHRGCLPQAIKFVQFAETQQPVSIMVSGLVKDVKGFLSELSSGEPSMFAWPIVTVLLTSGGGTAVSSAGSRNASRLATFFQLTV